MFFGCCVLEEKFEDNGIVCARKIYDECVGKQESELNKVPVVPMIQKVPDIKMIDDCVEEIISEESDFLVSTESKIEDCGEFYLEPNEWDEICQTDVNSKNILDSNWTNKFAENFSEANAMCVLRFKHYWLKKNK